MQKLIKIILGIIFISFALFHYFGTNASLGNKFQLFDMSGSGGGITISRPYISYLEKNYDNKGVLIDNDYLKTSAKTIVVLLPYIKKIGINKEYIFGLNKHDPKAQLTELAAAFNYGYFIINKQTLKREINLTKEEFEKKAKKYRIKNFNEKMVPPDKYSWDFWKNIVLNFDK